MSNARWQRTLVVLHLALLLGWLYAWWPKAPGVALAGVVLLPLLTWLGLLWQCVLAAWVGRSDAAPPPGLWRWLRAWWLEGCWATRVFGWWQPFRASAVADWLPERTPGAPAVRGVVLVHGFLCNRGFWTPWLRLLRARGHGVMALTLEPPFASIDDYAGTIDAAVRRVQAATGCAPLLIGHSMGGLAIRAWMRAFADADARVHRVVTLGSPHQGTWPARFAHSVNGAQMAPASAWLCQLAAQEPAQRRARMQCWTSRLDNVVYPAANAHLPGADNRWAPDLPHLALAFDAGIMRACLELLQQPGDPAPPGVDAAPVGNLA